ncbi:MAG TPA: hypothetical protein DET40_01255 [Lentisphaeria bacterium]|nr:MAG: hypothetical protein A2X45_12625 [Lentisphaerae bacterium GWF2_50_93]HCE42159.1 hypothetical protein [Lentisphaeria bacterium]
MSISPTHKNGFLDKAVAGVHWTAEKLHQCSAWLILSAARLTYRIIHPMPWSIRLGVFSTLWACLLVLYWMKGYDSLIGAAGFTHQHLTLLGKTRILDLYHTFVNLALALAVIMSVAAIMAFLRKSFSLVILRLSAGLMGLYTLAMLYFFCRIPSLLFAANDKSVDKSFRNELWIDGFTIWFLPAVFVSVFLLITWLNSSRKFYFGAPCEFELPGDRVLSNIKTHGGDPVFRTSLYWAAFIHFFFIFLLPLIIMGGWRWMTPYGVPKGSGVQNPGDPVVKMIRIKKPKKKPRQLFVLNPNSAILFYRPDIAESKVMMNVDEATEDKYEATGAEGKGKLGKGGGTKGGWPNGMEGAKIRFIRLKYEGGDWDQCMGVGADYNFLIKFNSLTGFKIADKTEAVDILDLKRFPRNSAPPFIYITGSSKINVGQKEIKTLRWYCLEEGGMIFADNGGGDFDYNFRSLIQRTFPEMQLIDISNDDIIYRQPYSFPNGAPPLWHHSGTRAMGLKYNGRWILFYHQGDIKDAWKDGHSGASKFLTEQAYKLGVNVVNYSFNQYMDLHFKP